MLPRASLGDDALLAHAQTEQRLPYAVVDLVRPGMVQVLSLQVDLRAGSILPAKQDLGYGKSSSTHKRTMPQG